MKTALAFLSIAVVLLLVIVIHQDAVIKNQQQTIWMLFDGCTTPQ